MLVEVYCTQELFKLKSIIDETRFIKNEIITSKNRNKSKN
jgi:hypothetical protein